jgi:hypothetical protein
MACIVACSPSGVVVFIEIFVCVSSLVSSVYRRDSDCETYKYLCRRRGCRYLI